MRPRLRLSPQTVHVLDAFLDGPKDWKYGYGISRNTGLKSGTLYPILIRLAERKLLKACWETAETGKPPRHMYRLTPDGLRYAREQVPSRSRRRVPQTALREA
jgi:DNA-binding PadR family transcriptional regulator